MREIQRGHYLMFLLSIISNTIVYVIMCVCLCISYFFRFSEARFGALSWNSSMLFRSAQARAHDDRAKCWNIGISYKRAYALSSYALTYIALSSLLKVVPFLDAIQIWATMFPTSFQTSHVHLGYKGWAATLWFCKCRFFFSKSQMHLRRTRWAMI